MELNELKSYSKEVLLKVLEKLDKKLKIYQSLEDTDGETRIKEVMSKFEKLYKEFAVKDSKIEEQDKAKLEDIKIIIDDIRKSYELTEEFISDEIAKREELKGKSGAEVVKRLYEFQLEELINKKEEFLKQAEDILKEEEEIEANLRDAIQEHLEIEYTEKLAEVRNRWAKVEKKVLVCHKNINRITADLECGWKYEIYGTIKKENLEKAYFESKK